MQFNSGCSKVKVTCRKHMRLGILVMYLFLSKCFREGNLVQKHQTYKKYIL